MLSKPLQVALFVAGTLLLPFFFLLPLRQQAVFPFAKGQLRRIEAVQPKVVLLGNSMLQTRISVGHLSTILGQPVFSLSEGGSAVARWYLAFKNYVAAAKHRPEATVIFFRDYELTNTSFRTQGKYREILHRMMNGPEPKLQQALLDGRDTRQIIWDDIHAAYPPSAWGSYGEEDAVFDAVNDALFPMRADKIDFRRTRIRRFRLEALRKDLGGDLGEDSAPEVTIDPRALQRSIDLSLLPEILKISAEKNIMLIFFRVERVTTRHAPDAKLAPYFSLLRSTIERGGGIYIEERDAIGVIPDEWYADGDHLNPRKKKDYTDRFFETAGKKLP